MKNQAHLRALLDWRLAAGLLIFTLMTLIVGEMGEEITNGQPLTLVDLRLSSWLQANRSPLLTTALRMVTEFGSSWLASFVAVGFGFYLLWRRRIYWFAAVWLAVFGGMGLNRMLKYAFHRARPSFDDPLLSLTGYSFPSGHTMTATVLCGVLAAYLMIHTKSFATRAMVIFSAGVLVAMVGFSRIYLGAHYLSDVLGALAEGLGWLSLCLTLVYSVWRHRDERKKAG